jgi:hypothetical protein
MSVLSRQEGRFLVSYGSTLWGAFYEKDPVRKCLYSSEYTEAAFPTLGLNS